jgi:hypothetical protein
MFQRGRCFWEDESEIRIQLLVIEDGILDLRFIYSVFCSATFTEYFDLCGTVLSAIKGLEIIF